MLKLFVILAIIAGGAYYWYSQNPASFNNATNTVSSDFSKAQGKAKGLR